MEQLSFSTGGHPFSIDDIVFLQSSVIQAISGVCNGVTANTNTVLSGCIITTTTHPFPMPPSYSISSGFIYYNGEVFYVPAHTNSGFATLYWTIVGSPPLTAGVSAIPAAVTYEDGGVHYTSTIREMQLTVASGDVLVSAVQRLRQVIGVVPTQGIINYFGSVGNFDGSGLGYVNGPTDGYALCNGQNGTPDLRGKFIVGYDSNDTDYNALGKTGGEKVHTLTKAEIPNHLHTITHDSHSHQYTLNDGGATASASTPTSSKSAAEHSPSPSTAASASGVVIDDGTIDGVGGGSHENRPPYYTLCYIMKL